MSSILDLYPDYEKTTILDELRKSEYGYLDAQKHVYLDYTGAGLAAHAQHLAHSKRLASTLLGNPHSVNPTSEMATTLVEDTRTRILAHLHASKDEYMVIFTQNATGAARLVGESYPFKWHSKLVMTADNHNSVNGLRRFASRGGARVKYIHSKQADLRIDTAAVNRALRGKSSAILTALMSSHSSPHHHQSLLTAMIRRRGLFAFPAQSNFSGVRHPLSWIGLAQESGFDVLLDAAAHLPTAALDLSQVKPEFVIMSWYKVFGYPTGLGCLVAKREAVARLNRPWFSGGTIRAVSVGMQWHTMAPDEAAFEDGTLNFLSIPDIAVGLDWIDNKIGKCVIETRVRCLTGFFIHRLQQLRHSDGREMTKIYGPTNMKLRGGTVCFNFIDAEGTIVDERLVALESAAVGISLRTGCFCNPGAGEDAFRLNKKKLLRLLWSKTNSIDEYIELIGLPSAGAVRVSFGLASTVGDLDKFFAFAECYKDRVATTHSLAPRKQC